MEQDAGFERRRLIVCAVCGTAASLLFPVAMAAPLPERLAYLLAFAIGPLISVGCLGLGRYLSLERKMVSAYLGQVFGVIAGVLLNAMLVVQGSNRLYFRRYLAEAGDEPTRESLKRILSGVSTVQLGLDVSWDIFIGVATVLFGFALSRRRGLERVLGVLGVIAGGALLTLNLSSFPVPPAEAGSIDVGPAVGLWFLLVSLRVLWVLLRRPNSAGAAA
jgi:hypothetical protein